MTDTLYVLHQGYGNDGALWCATWDGATWTDTPLYAGITGGPAVAVYNGVVHVFHQGVGDNAGVLMHMTYENGAWSADQSLGAGLSWNPAAVVYDDKLWVFHQDGGETGKLFHMTYDGTSWSADTQIPLGMSFSPSAAVFDDKLWLFHNGYDAKFPNNTDKNVWYSVYDGTSWSADARPPRLYTLISGSPSVTASDSLLYFFFQQYNVGATGKMEAITYDGSGSGYEDWTVYFRLPCGMSENPAGVNFNGSIYAFHQGYNDDGTLWYVRWNGSGWDNDVQCPPLLSDTPAVAVLPGG